MDYANYGQNITIGDMSSTAGPATSDSDPIGTVIPGLDLWGHTLTLSGDDGIECQSCDMEESIPELVQMSGGFREVIYKMYILSKFKRERCSSTFKRDDSVLNEDDRDGLYGGPNFYDPSHIYTVNTTSDGNSKLGYNSVTVNADELSEKEEKELKQKLEERLGKKLHTDTTITKW